MSARTDRELLDLAAKAAGIAPYRYGFYCEVDGATQEWDPLTDDGAALRLAVACDINVGRDYDADEPTVTAYRDDGKIRTYWAEAYGNDPFAATRRAIVLAAAEIGGAL